MNKYSAIIFLWLAWFIAPSHADDGTFLIDHFRSEVERRLEVPPQAQTDYAVLLDNALAGAFTPLAVSQYILLLDRNPNVQAIFLYWLDAQADTNRMHFIGASPVSTGKPGKYDHFITPLGVFAHTLDNLDYRAEGTVNSQGLRGLGRKGLRVYDFGWVVAERAWGRGGSSPMRLLLHATDPDRLERRLGEVQSRGCVRIPAPLVDFIDRYGLLDADYEQALAGGKKFWVLRPERTPTPWSGRYLVVIDSNSETRPDWSPEPAPPVKLKPSNKLTPASSPQAAGDMSSDAECWG